MPNWSEQFLTLVMHKVNVTTWPTAQYLLPQMVWKRPPSEELIHCYLCLFLFFHYHKLGSACPVVGERKVGRIIVLKPLFGSTYK